MPDPHVLYVVTAVVVLGLVAWVVVVLSRPAGEELGSAGLAPAAGGNKKMASAPPSGASATPSQPPSDDDKPKLDSHAEIRDDPSVNITAEVPVDVEEEEEPTGPNALILVTAVGRTDPGLKRKHNEDAYAILEDHHLFVIADGMGRHAAGEIASQLCVDAISESFKTADFGPVRTPPLPKRASRLRGSIPLGIRRTAADGLCWRTRSWSAGLSTTMSS